MQDKALDEAEAQVVERAMMRLEAEADAWMAETPEMAAVIRAMGNTAPPPFRERVSAQIDAIVRQAFCEAFYRGFNAHKDLAALRRSPEGGDAESMRERAAKLADAEAESDRAEEAEYLRTGYQSTSLMFASHAAAMEMLAIKIRKIALPPSAKPGGDNA